MSAMATFELCQRWTSDTGSSPRADERIRIRSNNSSSIREGGVVIIRDAVAADIPAIAGLYNALIPTTTVAWTEEIQTVDQRQTWFEKQVSDGFPVVVAEVTGWSLVFVHTAIFVALVCGLATQQRRNTPFTSPKRVGEQVPGERC
jgi:hypothetical protein